jgi:6-phosphogluconolactonase (cycloisomerase 2 family)
MIIHRLQGSFQRFSKAVLPFSLALALAGCGSSGKKVSSPGPEVLYGFASTSLLNLAINTTINPSTGGFGTVTSGAAPFFANSTAIVANNQFLYASNSYINSLPNNGSQIFAYSISSTDGTLTPITGSPFFLFAPPTFIEGLAITPNGQFLYGADASGFIYAFNIDSGTGAPTLIQGSPYTSGPNPQLVVDPTGKFLYVSDDSDPTDGVLAYMIGASGALTPVPGSPFLIPGPNGGTSEPFGIVATGGFVYTALLNQVAAFSIDSTTGALTSVSGSPFSAGNGTSFFAVSNSYLYAVNVNDGTVSGYRMNSSSGALTPLSGSPFGSGGETLATDPSGQYLYLGTFKGVQGYDIDSTTGALTLGSATFGEDGALWLTTVQLPSPTGQ